MTKMFNRAADRLLARLVPQTAASALPPNGVCNRWWFCYCSRGVAYRQYFRCHPYNSVGPCTPSGTC